MIKLISKNSLYFLWTLMNVSHDSIYKYITSLHFSVILFYKFLIIFIISLIINLQFLKQKKETKFLIQINFFKSISTMVGMICIYYQMKIHSLFSINLMFYMIPLFDIVFIKIHKRIKIFTYNNMLIIFNNIIVILYFIREIYLNGLDQYYLGLIGTIMFSISNLFILHTKSIWSQNMTFINYDICIFSFYMLIWSIFLIYYYQFNLTNILYNLFFNINIYLIIYLFFGIGIQYLLYYFFFINSFSPSIIFASIDLFISLIFSIFFKDFKLNYVELIIIIIIICFAYFNKKIKHKFCLSKQK